MGETGRLAEMENAETVEQRAARIRLLVLDVDGVLTDGSIVYFDNGQEWKQFHARDGSGLKFWREAGNRLALISGRSSPAVTRRAQELAIDYVYQGIERKLEALAEIVHHCGLELRQVAAMGDDLADLPLMQACGLGITVADACNDVILRADYVSPLGGGQGAVRDAIEWMLKIQGRWDEVLQRHCQQR